MMMVVVVALGRIVTMMMRRRRRRTWRWWCCDADTMMIPDRREAAIYSSWCFASVGETSMQVCFIQVLSQNIYHAYIIIYWFHLILVVNPCALPLASCRGRNPSSSPRKHQRTIRIKYLKIQVFEAFGHGSSLTALLNVREERFLTLRRWSQRHREIRLEEDLGGHGGSADDTCRVWNIFRMGFLLIRTT